MLQAEKLPESWITVHRAMSGSFSQCLDVGLDATEDDPIARRVGPTRRCRRRYVGYALANGFKNGRVILAQPRAGVCIASRVGRSWNPLVTWNRLRLLVALSSDQRDRLRSIEATVEEHAESGTWWVRCLAIRPRFRGRGVEPRLLRQVFMAVDNAPIVVQTAQEGLAMEMEEQGGERLETLNFGQRPSPLLLYRLAPEVFLRSVEATARA